MISNRLLPLLVRVTFLAALAVHRFWSPKLRLVAESDAVPEEAEPMRWMLCGLLPLELMVMAPPREPPAVGEKVTLMVQLLPAFSVVPHVLVSE